MIKIAIVEDDAPYRNTLRQVIESKQDFACVAEYSTGAEAMERIPHELPEVVMMDLNLPDFSGVEIIASLKASLPDISIIVLTVHSDANHIFHALRAGACGYLLKKTTAVKIIEAITEVHQGGAPMTTSIARRVIAAFHEQPRDPAMSKLSPREREILELVADGYTSKEVADKLSISKSTVCWNLDGIYKKLHVHSRVQAVRKFNQFHQFHSL
jgi:DNA-binding NarL/FixJ family response regulator